MSGLLLAIVVVAALVFDFTNGFHDTANVIAPAISTRALSPRLAVALAAVLNFAGAFISLKVAATVATGIVDVGRVTGTIAFAGLAGAIAWNLITWAAGLPSSSSHALIGGVCGAMLAALGGGVRLSGLLGKVIVPALVAPVLACAVGALLLLAVQVVAARMAPGPARRGFRAGQIVASGVLALAHGTNDAQKTMGVITLALLAAGRIGAHPLHVPTWVVICSASAMALGTYAAGWRIVRTVGWRIIRMDAAQGFVAEVTSSAVILVSSHFGYPLSSTQTISGAIVGAGTGRRVSTVRWGVAGSIATAWVLTLPVAGLLGAITWWIADAIGATAGPLLIVAMSGVLATAGVIRRHHRGRRAGAAATVDRRR